MELWSFWCKYIVVAEKFPFFSSLSDIMALFYHIIRDILFLVQIINCFWIFKHHVSIKCNPPITLNYEINFCYISFLLEYIPVIGCWLIKPWHETKSHLVDKVWLVQLLRKEKCSKSFVIDDIFVQKTSDNILLNHFWDSVKVLLFF